jgi:hypothetical protein
MKILNWMLTVFAIDILLMKGRNYKTDYCNSDTDVTFIDTFKALKWLLFDLFLIFRCILSYDIQYSKTGDQGSYISIVPEARRKTTTSFVYTPSPKQGS